MSSSLPTQPLQRTLDEGVLTLTLDRPQHRNAIDPELREALTQGLEEAGESPAVRAVVITGANGAFCGGGDLARFADLHDARAYRFVSHRLTALYELLDRLEKPTIAAIDGGATGAGLTLALACDWRVAAPSARLLFREGRIGLVPTHGGCTRLVKLVGLARAKELLLGGDELDAEGALRAGLVSELAPDPERLLAQAHARAERMLRRAPLSYGAAKRLLQVAADVDGHSGVVAEALAQTALLQSADHHEGLAAARERREPAFEGR